MTLSDRIEQASYELGDTAFRHGFIAGLELGRSQNVPPTRFNASDRAALEGALAEHKAIRQGIGE